MRPRKWFLYAGLSCVPLLMQPVSLVRVVGPSMEPSLRDGQVIVSSRLLGEVHRGDVVVANVDGEMVVKRVALVGGDRYPEFYFLDEWNQPRNTFMWQRAKAQGMPVRWQTIPAGSVYLLGDNDPVSTDSRHYGPVAIKNVVSRILNAPRFDATAAMPGSRLMVASR